MSQLPAWSTQKEIEWLEELARHETLRFRERTVDCAKVLSGYAAGFSNRTRWGSIKRETIENWLRTHGLLPSLARAA